MMVTSGHETDDIYFLFSYRSLDRVHILFTSALHKLLVYGICLKTDVAEALLVTRNENEAPFITEPYVRIIIR
jgi:hypothetical protein